MTSLFSFLPSLDAPHHGVAVRRLREIQEEQAARKESVLKLKEQEVHERHVKVNR